MRKRRILLLIGIPVAVVAIVVFVTVLTREREPEYGGKKLSEWVERYCTAGAGGGSIPPSPTPEQLEAREAIRHIGTNAVPYLVKWMAYERPLWKDKVDSFLARMNVRSWRLGDNKHLPSIYAGSALVGLGPDAEVAIPGLIRLANNPRGSTSRVSAVSALHRLGKSGTPALVGVLTNQQTRFGNWMPVWAAAARYVGDDARLERTTANSAVPALLERAKDPDMHVRAAAIYALEKIDWPALKKLYPQW